MDSFKSFNEDKLSDKCEFFSSSKDKCISKEEYDRAINIGNVFKIKELGEYHDFYFKTDVLLLADVFEKFIKTCLENYKLGPCHYFSSPGLSFDAILIMTGVVLELISDIDIDMHFFIEKGIRGVIPYICKIIEDCDINKKKKKSIMYWDTNNLYGWGMNQPLPYGGFDWLREKEINDFCLNSISENSSIGYFLEVDLEYRNLLHDYHNDYPEKLKISSDMLSKPCSHIADKYGINVGEVKRLVPNLRDKRKYIVHYRNP